MLRQTRDNILMVVLGIAFFFNIIVMNLFPPTIEELVLVGYMTLGIGALFFILSVLTLWRKGISNVVDSGIYRIVRHPMYLGGMVMFFSHILLGQNWMVAISTVVGIACCYLTILSEDQQNIEKFGDTYEKYMKSTPAVNVLAGIIRSLQRRKENSEPGAG